jgi:hypothetical protein
LSLNSSLSSEKRWDTTGLKYEQFLKSCLRIPASRASALTVALTIMQLVAPGHFLLARHAHTRP